MTEERDAAALRVDKIQDPDLGEVTMMQVGGPSTAPARRDLSEVRLYELTDQLALVYAALADNGGELTEELEAELDRAEGDVREKVRRTCQMLRQKEASAKVHRAMLDAYLEETARLRAIVKADESAVKGLKGYVLGQLKKLGLERLEVPGFRLAARMAPRPSIRWLGKGSVPTPFRKEPELDGEAAYREWKAKGKLPRGFGVAHTEWLDVR